MTTGEIKPDLTREQWDSVYEHVGNRCSAIEILGVINDLFPEVAMRSSLEARGYTSDHPYFKEKMAEATRDADGRGVDEAETA